MTRDELYALVWSKPVTEVGLLVGLSGNGLAKACRRNGVQVPPRGYWQRVEAGQVIERAAPPDSGQVETHVLLKGSRRPVKDDATGAMLRRRVAQAPAAAKVKVRLPAKNDVADECARILERGLRQQLRDAASAYLSGLDAALRTLDEDTARTASIWIESARATLAVAGPAAEAVEALRHRAARHQGVKAWLGALVCMRPTAQPSRGRRRARSATEPDSPE